MSYVSTGRPARGFRGFGDAASDYAANHAAWLREKAAYDLAAMGFAAASAAASSGYAASLASWNAQSTARAAAVAAQQRQLLANQTAMSRANIAARAAGAVTPADYSGCVSQAQHDSWVASCSFVSQTVKGLGADPTGSPCALALLPVCPPPVAAVPPLGPRPVQPPPPTPPAILQTTLRPEPAPPGATAPTPPVLNTAPQSIPSNVPTLTTTSAAPSKSGGLLSNGLIVVVLAAGGYALYRTFKKPKAAA